MTQVTNRLLRRGKRLAPDPEKVEYQVVMQLAPSEQMSDDELEAAAIKAVNLLTRRAAMFALGPVGGVHLTTRTVEVEFTVEAAVASSLYAMMSEVLAVLHAGGFEFEASHEARLNPGSRQLQPA